ncbi:unnamed protein product [Cuscuta europaea]|uniref:VQ domain-containing protein n=1 Tax=Cuscuta europaea TaxID=41803 RepID=A0A9P0ZLP3_CUSEU|nr:unnamed protein product [Cuscuta europaea]
MSESNETSPSLTPNCSWVQFCQRNAQPTATGPISSPSNGLSPDGRVAKPARRRPRASRRTPTTVFNTDPSNFRAMVQQFTGGGLGLLPPPLPSPFSFPGGTAAAGLGFRFGPPHQVLENLINFPQRAASNHSMHFEAVAGSYTSPLMTSSGGRAYDVHTQPFVGRVSFPSPQHGGSASSSGLE